MALQKLEHKAQKGTFLTLNELSAFVREAMRSGASGDEIVHAGVSLGGKLQRLTAEVPVPTGPRLDKDAR